MRLHIAVLMYLALLHLDEADSLSTPTVGPGEASAHTGDSLPTRAYTDWGDGLRTPKIWTGLGQFAGMAGRGFNPDRAGIVEAMKALTERGLTAFEIPADGQNAEELVADLRAQIKSPSRMSQMSFASTWAPNAQRPRDITFRLTEDAVDASLLRMGADEIDLLQLSWNDFENPAFNDALYQLCELQRAGKVRHIGVIDFEEAPLKEAIGNGFQVTSNNMKCSMINLPSQGLLDLCEAQNVQLIARAVLLGGLLSDRWLLKSDKMTASLSAAEVRHFPSITQWAGGTRGRWDQFQRLLKNTREVSEKYSATIATVAIRRVLDSPAIGAAVIGSSLEETSDYSPQDLVKALEMSLDRDALDYLDRATAPRK